MNTPPEQNPTSVTPALTSKNENWALSQLSEWGFNDPEQVFMQSKKIALALQDFASRYPVFRQVRINPLALTIAAAAPFCNSEALISVARVSLWIFALDDQFDEALLPADEIIKRAENYQLVVNEGMAHGGGDPLVEALEEIAGDLHRYPLFSPLREQWSAAMLGTIDGMITEHQWRKVYQHRGPSMFPSYEEYLAVGRYSIGGPPHIWSMLVTIEDPSTPALIDQLTRMENAASICIRLANDLKTHKKEQVEGKFNSLDILSHAYQKSGMPLLAAKQAAQDFVHEEIGRRLASLDEMGAIPCTASGQPEASIIDIARLVSRFYKKHDFHKVDVS